MDKLRSIIREEVRRTLFGQPIPERGEKGFKAYMHDLETVLARATHYQLLSNAMDATLLDIKVALDMSWPEEFKIEQISNYVKNCEKKIRELKREWRQEADEIMKSIKAANSASFFYSMMHVKHRIKTQDCRSFPRVLSS